MPRSLSVDGEMPMYAVWFGTLWSTSREVVPHFDRTGAEMGRRCAGSEGDPHR